MITAASLNEFTLKDLGQMAKKRGVLGWHSMRKADLIKAIVQNDKKNSRKTKTVGASKAKANGSRSNGQQRAKTQAARKLQRANEQKNKMKDLSCPETAPQIEAGTDRIVLMVRDPYWLHAYWELSSQLVKRARAAMAEMWHTAKPVLRVMEIATDSKTASETVVRDIPIHGGVKNWYIDVTDPPNSFRVEIGYLDANGRFLSLARSNTVTTPRPDSADLMDGNWSDVADNCEKIFALSGGFSQESATDELRELFEERLRRPLGSPMVTRYGAGAQSCLAKPTEFKFDVDAEMIVYGVTKQDAHVTLGGEPIKIQDDGSFSVRLNMPERRQVLPVVASSRDGTEQQTIVLAIERNTKVMEPVVRDANGTI